MLIIAISGLLFSECKKNEDNNSPQSRELIPLEVGNNWKWSRSYYWGNRNSDTTWTVLRDTMINGEKGYIAYGENWGGTQVFLNRSDGFYIGTWDYYMGGSGEFEIYLEWKYPVTIGEEFISGRYGEKWKAVSTDVIKTVLGIDFECIDYINGSGHHFYIAPSLGIIEYTYPNNNGSDRGFGLVDYTLN